MLVKSPLPQPSVSLGHVHLSRNGLPEVAAVEVRAHDPKGQVLSTLS